MPCGIWGRRSERVAGDAYLGWNRTGVDGDCFFTVVEHRATCDCNGRGLIEGFYNAIHPLCLGAIDVLTVKVAVS